MGEAAEFSDGSFLAGEDPTSEDPEDVEHWIKVYSELVGATHDLKPAATEGSEDLDDRLSGMVGRLEFWLKRRGELASGTDAS